MRPKIYVCILIAFALLPSLFNLALAQLKPETLKEIQLLVQEKNNRTSAQKKMDSRLLQFVRENQGRKMVAGINLEPAKMDVNSKGTIKVDITADVSDNLLAKIEAMGGKIVFSSIRFHSITAEISFSIAEKIAGLSEVKFLEPAAVPMLEGGRTKAGAEKTAIKNIFSAAPKGSAAAKNLFEERAKRVRKLIEGYLEKKDFSAPMFAGAANSEGDRTHRADDARNAYGYAGQGIRIGVLSDSYNSLGAAAADVANGDLPGPGNPLGNTTPVTVLQDISGGSDEGRAMLQIVHDLAPKAQLYYATAFVSSASFASNIIALRSAPYNCDIIIDDVSYGDEAVFYDGLIAQAVNTVTADGALYFSSAGNSGSLAKNTSGAYEADFNDAGSLAFTGSSKVGSIHNFGTVSSPVTGDSITTAGSFYALHWADAAGASTNDYDLFVISSTGTVKQSSTTVQNGTQNPLEFISAGTLSAGDRLVVFKASGAASRAFHLNTSRGKLKYATNGQTHGHASAAAAFCVAAAPAVSPGPFPAAFSATSPVETFSSDGPRRIFFNANGTPVTPGNFLFGTNGGTVRSKPDLTAADGVSTTLPGSSGLNPFYGTSAAAPHAGAIAGLLKSANPALTAAEIRTILTTTAVDIESPGYDDVSGIGIIQAFQAMQAVSPAPQATVTLGTVTSSEGSFKNNNGVIDPGELANFTIQLNNPSMANATDVIGTLTTSTPGVTVTQGTSNYGNINGGSSAVNGTPFVIGINSSVVCGSTINLVLTTGFGGGPSPQGLQFSVTVGSQPLSGGISSTLGGSPSAGAGYTVVSGQQTGRLVRGSGASTCAVPIANPGLNNTTGARQYSAYTFTNSNSTSQCVTATVTSSNGPNIYTAAYNSNGFVPSNPSANYIAEPGQSALTMQYSFTVGAGQPFTVVVHDVNVTPASNSSYTLHLSLANCSAGPSCTPVNITTASIAGGATGAPYNQAFAATGGSGSYTFSVLGSLPAGLSVTGNTLSGSPTQAGSFPISVVATDPIGCPSDTNSYTLIIAGNAPDSVYVTSGTPQTTLPGTAFLNALQATVFDAENAPLSGINVTFTAPTTGASGTFPGGVSTVTVVTNASGVATAPTFTANTTPGNYIVTASVNGVDSPASFNLGNVCLSTVVTSSADDGPGSLRYILNLACSGSTITFDPGVTSISLTSGQLVVKKPITITGPGANLLTISAGNLSRVMYISPSSNTSAVTISGLTLRDGKLPAASTFGGAGVLIDTGIVNITGCVITNNDASAMTSFSDGGGLYNGSAGLVTIDKSSIINNISDRLGGGIAQWGSARITITNSTISGNRATGTASEVGYGGGIFSNTLMTITNCTVFGDTALIAGGNIFKNAGTITIGNSIFGGGVLSSGAGAANGRDIYGALSSMGYNLIQNAGGFTVSGITTGNQSGVNPKVFPLADYGGTVPACLPMSNSPVINAGNTSLTSGTDQRGKLRFVGERADIGAVETNYSSSAASGTPQTTPANTQFALPLKVTVTESGSVIAGDTVIFTAPAQGASGTFSRTSSIMDTAVTNVAGIAESSVFTANDTTGTYNSTASIGSQFSPVTFALTNVYSSSITDYFRTRALGNWNDVSTWESSPDSISWYAATRTPDFNANTVTILNPYEVTVTANVTIDQATVQPTAALGVANGVTLTVTNNGLLLQSSVAGTARIANSDGGTITGNVTVERYIPSRRAWRLMTAPVSNSNTIYQAWQNSGVSTSGAGTYITAPGGGNGLDNGNTYSLKTYNTASQVLENVTSTNVSLSAAAASAANKGYFLFVRGDRTPANLTPPNTNITTLSSIGSLQTGAQTFAASGTANNFTLIGNPYASPVDFSLLSRNNVAKRFYAWDPALNTVGGYVLLDDMDDNGTYSITPSSSQTNILQSGQAVFVQTLSDEPATVTFNESSKSDVTASAGFRTNNGSSEIFRTNLYLKNADSTTTLADGVLSEYNNIFSPAVTMEDGAKMENINENLAIARSSKLLALERRPLVDGNDTLFLNLTQTTARAYSFEFVPSNIASVVSAWLEDTYLKTSTPLSVTSATLVDFSVTSDAASANANRFRIVFKTSGVLPVNFTNVKAYEKNAGIQVDWKVAAESNIRKYEAEKSADGRTFEKLADVAATGNNNTAVSYGSFDVNPVKGNNFYRIKVIENSGKIRYSQVVNVKIGSNKGDIVLYPNPVKDRVVYLQLNNQPKGKYVVELLNALGQRLFATTITHLGGSASQTIQMPSVVSKGIYQLKIKNGENAKTQQIIFE